MKRVVSFIIKRIIHTIPILLGVSIISFIIIQLAPGDYFSQLQLNPAIDRSVVDSLRQRFGFDKPIIVQYWRWLIRLLHLDFGYSLAYNVPVTSLIIPRLFNTLLLSVTSMCVVWIVVIPLGIWSSLKRYSIGDYLLTIGSFIGISLPTFFFAFIMLYIASLSGWLPVGGVVDLEHNLYSPVGRLVDYGRHLFIPVIVISLGSIAGLFRIIRANMVDELGQPYILAARARGIGPARLVFKHAFRNAVNPLITIFGFQLSTLLSGAALTEIIVSWPGMGSLLLDAVLKQDLYLVMASITISAVLLICGNLIADILLAVADPRIRLGEDKG